MSGVAQVGVTIKNSGLGRRNGYAWAVAFGSAILPHIRIYTLAMAENRETRPPQLSTVTVALMIQLFESMYRTPTILVHSTFDFDQLPTTLFAMGFERRVIESFRRDYYWNFGAIFPALHDGNFFGGQVNGILIGEEYLRGFATFLCGAFTQHPNLRTTLIDRFERSLSKDGYRFDGNTLVEVGLDTSIAPEVGELPKRQSLLLDMSSKLDADEAIAILFIDLDHFKQVNDKLSHAQGDDCLATIVKTISEVLRYRGKLYRVGGDEFCALLPNFGIDEASATAERIRKSIDALRSFGDIVKVTASIGVAASDLRNLRTAEALVKAADEAMYVAKFTTKNRICSWPPSETDAAGAKMNREKLGRESRDG